MSKGIGGKREPGQRLDGYSEALIRSLLCKFDALARDLVSKASNDNERAQSSRYIMVHMSPY